MMIQFPPQSDLAISLKRILLFLAAVCDCSGTLSERGLRSVERRGCYCLLRHSDIVSRDSRVYKLMQGLQELGGEDLGNGGWEEGRTMKSEVLAQSRLPLQPFPGFRLGKA